MTKLTEVEGIGNTYAEKLIACGVITQEQLLEQGAKPAGRKKIAEKSGIRKKLILKWINRADLSRLKGIGSEYADLLEHAGVDTVAELSNRNTDNLYQKMLEVNEEKNLVRALPSRDKIDTWVKQAKSMDRAVFY